MDGTEWGIAAEIEAWPGYHARSVTEQPPVEAPVDPLFSHAASPFIRTEVPPPAGFASPAELPTAPMSAWSAYRNQVYSGFAVLAYLMVLVGCVTAVQANPTSPWRYYVAAVPVLPAALVVWLFVRALERMDEVQKRIQVQAIGFSVGLTALVTFGYGFMEAVGLEHLNPVFVLPCLVVSWGAGVIFLDLKRRLRR